MLIFVDIDGTCTNAARRFKRAGKEPKGRGPAYYKWLAKVQTPRSLMADKPVAGMQRLVSALDSSGDVNDTVYLTGREEIHRRLTLTWLEDQGFPSLPLIMRPIGNIQSNGEFKEKVILGLTARLGLRKEPVVVIDDDHTGEIEIVCRKHGWTFLKARSGS